MYVCIYRVSNYFECSISNGWVSTQRGSSPFSRVRLCGDDDPLRRERLLLNGRNRRWNTRRARDMLIYCKHRTPFGILCGNESTVIHGNTVTMEEREGRTSREDRYVRRGALLLPPPPYICTRNYITASISSFTTYYKAIHLSRRPPSHHHVPRSWLSRVHHHSVPLLGEKNSFRPPLRACGGVSNPITSALCSVIAIPPPKSSTRSEIEMPKAERRGEEIEEGSINHAPSARLPSPQSTVPVSPSHILSSYSLLIFSPHLLLLTFSFPHSFNKDTTPHPTPILSTFTRTRSLTPRSAWSFCAR